MADGTIPKLTRIQFDILKNFGKYIYMLKRHNGISELEFQQLLELHSTIKERWRTHL